MVFPKSWESNISSEYPALYATICTIIELHSIQLYNNLIFLAIRLIEMKRILNSTGSVFIHCGSTFSHYVKLCMDGIFGRDKFRNEIVWCYLGRGITEGQETFQKKHQIIFFYSVTDQYKFNREKASRIVNGRRTFMNLLGNDFSQFAVEDGRPTDQILIEYWWPLPPNKGNRIVGFPNRKPPNCIEQSSNRLAKRMMSYSIRFAVRALFASKRQELIANGSALMQQRKLGPWCPRDSRQKSEWENCSHG